MKICALNSGTRGRSLDELLLIKEQSSNQYRPMYAEAMMRGSSPRVHASLTSSQIINGHILVEFSFKD